MFGRDFEPALTPSGEAADDSGQIGTRLGEPHN